MLIESMPEEVDVAVATAAVALENLLSSAYAGIAEDGAAASPVIIDARLNTARLDGFEKSLLLLLLLTLIME